jgi:hypothetical protein
MAKLLRHRQTKGAATDRLGLRDAESCSLLYPHGLTPHGFLDPTWLSSYACQWLSLIWVKTPLWSDTAGLAGLMGPVAALPGLKTTVLVDTVFVPRRNT